MFDHYPFNPNAVGNTQNNIFGLPFSEEEAQLIILPVPWEVTVSYGAGTSRAADHIYKASKQVDIFDVDGNRGWEKGFFMKEVDKRLLMKSDYLRKEAELYINYISKGDEVAQNKFMCKSLKEINEGNILMNEWVYNQTKELLQKGKLVVLLGGDHSTPLGYMKALAEVYGNFGVLQIDAHCDLRDGYEGFQYSHASIMYNALKYPQISSLIQVGIRDFCEAEYQLAQDSDGRVRIYDFRSIEKSRFGGETWHQIVERIIANLPQNVYVSFDIDGLDPSLCPNTGTPVPGGFKFEEAMYLIECVVNSGRKMIGFDLNEVAPGEEDEWDANVGARVLYKLCNFMGKSNGLIGK